MTLLQSIAAAAPQNGGADVSGDSFPAIPDFPIVLNPESPIHSLTPQFQTLDPIKRVENWQIPESDAQITSLTSKFAQDLKSKLSKRKPLKEAEFLTLFNSFLKRFGEKIGLVGDSELYGASETQLAVAGIEKLGSWFVAEVAGLIALCCIVVESWEVLAALIVQGRLRHLYSMDFVGKLVEKNKSEMVCIYVKYLSDLRSSEIVSVLKYFLSPNEVSYRSMMDVRKIWENQAILAVEEVRKARNSKKLLGLATEAAILLMMAYDGFSSLELCLHYVFGSLSPDGLVFASAISKLDGVEVLSLVRYLVKWLEKYNRFPEAKPCPSAGPMLGLVNCDSVPTLESVVKALGFVLDEHLFYLVLNPEAREELRRADNVVNSLAMEANLCAPLDSIVKKLQLEKKDK